MEDPKLSRAEKKLLQAALESGQADGDRLTIDQIAESTGNSVAFVYKKLQDQEFKTMFMEALRSSHVAEVPAILQKFADLGRQGSFKHGKLILELAGVYSEESTVNVKTDLGADPFKSDEERQDFARRTLEKYMEKEEG